MQKLFTIHTLTVLSVSGQDAGKLLNGQLTCDILQINPEKASFAAICNPKGRVISPLLVQRVADAYYLVLPFTLLSKVKDTLQKYILRSDVKLTDLSQSVFLTGLKTDEDVFGGRPLPKLDWEVHPHQVSIMRIPSSLPRYLLISDKLVDGADQFIEEWFFDDVTDGFPWITLDQSESYTPHMLNLDSLHAISYNKGCYTGQEIVARTHFLGKAKRELVVLQLLDITNNLFSGMPVLAAITKQKMGEILQIVHFNKSVRVSVVLSIECDEMTDLILDDGFDTRLTFKLD